MAVSPQNPNNLFCVGTFYFNSAYHLGVSHSSDGGLTWEHDTVDSGGRAWAIAFDPIDSNKVYVGGDSGYSYPALYISTDLGLTWNRSYTGLRGQVYAITPDPFDNQIVYCGTTAGVYKSTNGGAFWDSLPLRRSIRALVIDSTNNYIYAGTYGYGVYLSTDGGVSWDTFNFGLTNRKVLSLALRSGEEPVLFAGTEGGAVFRTIPPTAITDKTPPKASQPKFKFSISPNPNYGKVKVALQLNESATVSISLFDYTGRKVANYGTHLLPMGDRFWYFETENLASGVYFYELKIDGIKTVHKMTMIKR
ncbi:MAG: T9SS type A sorting domain-containing protein [candidate division WOR-3 bacterium]